MKLEKELIGEILIQDLRYDAETGLLFWTVPKKGRDLTKAAGSNDGQGYVQICSTDDTGKRWNFLAHIIAWRLYYGYWPAQQIDHCNRCRNDNRISNLRLVTHQENHMNQGVAKSNKLGYQNISMNRNSYLVQVMLHGKFITQKYFRSLHEAIAHRDAIRAEYNFPPATDIARAAQ